MARRGDIWDARGVEDRKRDLVAHPPHRIQVRGEERPKELAHAELMSEWVEKLRPDASEALRIAARAHHVRRWEIPRDSHPAGRRGYLEWRVALHDHHAEVTARIARVTPVSPGRSTPSFCH